MRQHLWLRNGVPLVAPVLLLALVLRAEAPSLPGLG